MRFEEKVSVGPVLVTVVNLHLLVRQLKKQGDLAGKVQPSRQAKTLKPIVSVP